MTPFPGLEALTEALAEDTGLLRTAVDGISSEQQEILYSTLLGMSREERHQLLTILSPQSPENRSFLINTIGNGLVDHLTGLYNRTKFTPDLEAAIGAVDRCYHQRMLDPPSSERRQHDPVVVSSSGEPKPADVSVLLLDIDNFKQVNDRYGHDVGDMALRLAATIAANSLRAEDHQRFYRYGGEEFIVILPYTSVDQAVIVAERIRSTVETALANSLPPTPEYPARGITFSIGVANYRATTANSVDLVKQADLALYAAKNAGRNCVKVYDSSMS